MSPPPGLRMCDLGVHSGRERILLAPLAVHVWHADPGALATPEARRACMDLLDDREAVRLGRFQLEVDRTTYLAAHALLRSVLSVHAPADPRAWRFVAGPHGKPGLVSPTAHLDLAFNLSHARGRVAVAVTRAREVGIDVEDAARAGAMEDLVDRFLSPVERRALRELPPEARRERLLACWTLKESYLKARGTGLSLPLQALTFHLDGGPEVRATFDASAHDDPARWAFIRLAPGPDHPAAVAFRREPGEDLAVYVREVRGLPHPV